MSRLQLALDLLQADARPSELAGMARFGIIPEARLGLSMPAMRRIAKTLGSDHELALQLWDTGISEARIVAGMLAEQAKLTSSQMDDWVKGFASWDVCDQVCGSVFQASSLAWHKVSEWAVGELGAAQHWQAKSGSQHRRHRNRTAYSAVRHPVMRIA